MWLRLQQKQMDFRLRVVSVPGVYEESPRNGVQTEKNRDMSVIMMFMLHVMTYISNKLF